ASRLLGNGHGDDGFALLAQLRALGHMAQAIEVDVGTRIDAHQHLVGHAIAPDILLDASHRQRTRRLGDRAGIVVNVLDRGAQLVGADRDDFIDMVFADIEGVLADLRHRHAVGKQPDLGQHHSLTGGYGLLQAVGIVRLYTDDPGFRAQILDIGRHPGDQPTSAHRHEDGVQRSLMLTEDLHGHGALPGDHVGVVVGMDVDVALFLDQFQRVRQRLGESIAVQHDLAATGAYALDLQPRCGTRHDNGGLDPQFARCQRQTLSMVAGRCGNHAARQFLGRKLRQLVVGAANLEGKHRLQILALEQNLVTETLGELAGGLQRSFHGHVVDARGEDLLDVLFEHDGYLGGACEDRRVYSHDTPPTTGNRPADKTDRPGTG